MNLSLTITGSREELAQVLNTLQSAQVGQLQVETGPVQVPAQQAPVTPVQPPAQAPTTPVASPVTPVAPPDAPQVEVVSAPQQPAQAPTATAAPVTPAVQPAPTTAPAAPTAVPEYDFNQIATATMQLQQAGHDILELFREFGIQTLNQLPKERYGEYAAVLRQRGAKI